MMGQQVWLCNRLSKALAYGQDPLEAFAVVQKIVRMMFPKFDFSSLRTVFGDIVRLFAGKYPGYRKCNTFYHDLNHTIDCLLVMTRLIHGGYVRGIAWLEKDVSLGLISALMHDTGYIQTMDDDAGTGAKYTLIHIERSIEFMEAYFKQKGYSEEDFIAGCNFLRCTGLNVKIAKIQFKTREHEIMGKILGAADLIGQMSDKNYLAKLPFLYHEFAEGGITDYKDELDLFRKTARFWEVVRQRFVRDLSGVDEYLRDHFRVFCGLNKNLYQEAIEKNLECLQSIIERADGRGNSPLEEPFISTVNCNLSPSY
jgi:hypothetical protein